MDEFIGMLSGLMVVFGIFKGMTSCINRLDAKQDQYQSECKKICKNHPVKWANEKTCGCDVSTTIEVKK